MCPRSLCHCWLKFKISCWSFSVLSCSDVLKMFCIAGVHCGPFPIDNTYYWHPALKHPSSSLCIDATSSQYWRKTLHDRDTKQWLGWFFSWVLAYLVWTWPSSCLGTTFYWEIKAWKWSGRGPLGLRSWRRTSYFWPALLVTQGSIAHRSFPCMGNTSCRPDPSDHRSHGCPGSLRGSRVYTASFGGCRRQHEQQWTFAGPYQLPERRKSVLQRSPLELSMVSNRMLCWWSCLRWLSHHALLARHSSACFWLALCFRWVVTQLL